MFFLRPSLKWNCFSLFMLFISISLAGHGQVKNNFSLVDELKTLYNVSALPLYREHTLEAQVSSYDTTGGNDDGFNGKYSYLRKNTDGSLVIFDQKGPGVINRIWTPTPTKDTLDFFIDDDSRPAISLPFLDLFSGNKAPFVHPLCGNQLGGYYCYFPILFQKYCRIVYRGKRIQFHQIQYRLYPPNSQVKKFQPVLGNEEQAAMQKINSLWNAPSPAISNIAVETGGDLLTLNTTFNIKPGETKKIFDLEEGGRIVGIEFERTQNAEWNKDIDMRVSWDDDKTPAIDAPVADFFGYAFGKPSMQSILLGSRGRKDYCYFPMPFDQKASIELIYRKSNDYPTIEAKAIIYYTKSKRIPAQEGRMYTCWNSNILEAGSASHIFLKTQGKGHYVGSVLQSRGLNSGMTYFFEGDDSTAVDGVPRIHGTGSEDYFNGGWYALLDRWDTKFSLPIHGALEYSLPFCRTGAYRFYLSDKISFEKSIFQSIEHGPVANSAPAQYTSLAFYYCDKAPVSNLTPTRELTEVNVPDTLVFYPQLMEFSLDGQLQVKTTWGQNTGGLSYIFTAGQESLIKISLAALPPANYKLYLDFTKQTEGCDFSIWQRQSQLTDWISSNGSTGQRMPQFFLADLGMDELKNSITIHLRPNQNQKTFLLNRLILVKQK